MYNIPYATSSSLPPAMQEVLRAAPRGVLLRIALQADEEAVSLCFQEYRLDEEHRQRVADARIRAVDAALN